jgi:hypothetical protein
LGKYVLQQDQDYKPRPIDSGFFWVLKTSVPMK